MLGIRCLCRPPLSATLSTHKYKSPQFLEARCHSNVKITWKIVRNNEVKVDVHANFYLLLKASILSL